ncbi:MAG: alpha amylase [Firmicutes bacterium]|nr:alpha amylase [Bacillota bacterium]
MDTLLQIVKFLKARADKGGRDYYIPEAWNYFGYTAYEKDPARPGEIRVCPYHFFHSCLETQILTGRTDQFFGPVRKEDSSVLDKRAAIYGMLPRAYTAWRHDRSDRLYPGTFLKSMALLPFLKELGVEIIYLLPVFTTGARYTKGEMGSPYAIKNHYRLAPELHDPLLDGENIGIEEEFKAFIEASHLLGMKVMVDFVFRTVARDHELLIDHPDWFYWMGIPADEGFSLPPVKKIPPLTYPRGKALRRLYRARETRSYLQRFTYPPSVLNPELWEEVKARQRQTGENPLTLIEEAFGITTAPGFSNMLNDPQPPWFDVTYLKLYFDLHPEARIHLGKPGPGPDPAFHGYAPFILPDGACANLYRGEKPNRELWAYLIDIIPYYQQVYGIDGARIDMGHALPPELLHTLIARVKAVNPAFLLWSEEFHPRNATALKRKGFHFITGSLWALYKRWAEAGFMAEVLRHTLHSALPVTAALETPDTPRLAYYCRDKRQIEMLTLLNFLLPNTIPFLNNGLELLERQPMNLGLDNTEEGRFVLEPDDPVYGKLAFFDNYCLHWRNNDFAWMTGLLRKANYIRTRFFSVIQNPRNLLRAYSRRPQEKLLRLGYYSAAEKRGLVFLANKDLQETAKIRWVKELPRPFRAGREVRLLYSTEKQKAWLWPLTEEWELAPGEVIILETGEEEA